MSWEDDDLRERYRDDPSEIPDDAWEAAINETMLSVGEACDSVRADLAEDDDHGQFLLNTLYRQISDRLEDRRR
jgi:hypothetical protein